MASYGFARFYSRTGMDSPKSRQVPFASGEVRQITKLIGSRRKPVIRDVCLHGKYGPMGSPFGGGAYVLTLLCGHLWSWNIDREGEFPAQVDCIHCDRDERKQRGEEPKMPWDTGIGDIVQLWRSKQATESHATGAVSIDDIPRDAKIIKSL